MHSRLSAPPLGWLGIIRLGLVQASLGAVVVLATSTMNRLMIVEQGMPALLPGILIAWHYLIQILRPRLGHGSDQGGRRTPWIIGGVAMMAAGGVGAAAATVLMGSEPVGGVALAVIAYSLIGVGVGCAGTSLLVLLAQRTASERRPAAATLAWTMMIAGIVITAGVAGHALEPYSATRLLTVVGAVALLALGISTLAVWGMEGRYQTAGAQPRNELPEDAALEGGMAALINDERSLTALAHHGRGLAAPVKDSCGRGASVQAVEVPRLREAGFLAALGEVWREPQSRRFAIFVFLAMLAYSAQELLLDPFAGTVYGYSPGASTQLAGLQHGGALLGMILVGVIGQWFRGHGIGSPRVCTLTGCAASAGMLTVIGISAIGHMQLPLGPLVFALGVANGTFAVSAIASMMQMVGQGARRRQGVRMGLWGAAQAMAFAAGGLTATGLCDLIRLWSQDTGLRYGLVFLVQAVLFLCAAGLAQSLWQSSRSTRGEGDAQAALLGGT